MFGRRTPDRPPAEPVEQPTNDLGLEPLPDLPDIATPVAQEPSPWSARPSTTETTWPGSLPKPAAPSATTPGSPVPAMTQRLPVQSEPASTQTLAVPPTPAGAEKPASVRPRTSAESVIGPDDFFDGHYRSERGVRIQGKARGSIESRQYIFVEAGAQVDADLSAEDITVSGSLSGKIECRRRLEVTGTGKVEGQVQTALLVVQEGGVVDGELHMRKGETPAPESPNGTH
jgi:cytoskeletal protein CcmA (bactofilin family)